MINILQICFLHFPIFLQFALLVSSYFEFESVFKNLNPGKNGVSGMTGSRSSAAFSSSSCSGVVSISEVPKICTIKNNCFLNCTLPTASNAFKQAMSNTAGKPYSHH